MLIRTRPRAGSCGWAFLAPSTASIRSSSRARPAAGMREYVYDTLMARSYDEPFSLYGLIAESVDTPEDRSSVTFQIRPEARFADGTPVTPDDVLFSWSLLKSKGRPNHRTLLRQGCGSRKDRRARREIHLRGRRRPRDAPHHGAAAGAATSRGHARKLRQDQLRQAPCQRPLRGRGGFAGRQHRAEAEPQLLGPEPPGHARPVQFRHDPHRLLSRQHRHVGSLPQGAVRRDGRQRFHRRREMGGRLRFSGRAAGARQETGIQRGRAGADGRAGLQHEAAHLRGPARARGT